MFARLSYHNDIAIIATPYSRVFVEELKAMVPHEYREWVAGEKVWRVQHPYDRQAASVLKKHFPHAEIEARWESSQRSSYQYQQPKPFTGCKCDADHRALFICADAPREVVTAAYKALAKQTHPDRGGDLIVMQKLNEVYERLLEGARL